MIERWCNTRSGAEACVRPWRRAFCDTRRLPSSDLGPVLFFAFVRLAAITAVACHNFLPNDFSVFDVDARDGFIPPVVLQERTAAALEIDDPLFMCLRRREIPTAIPRRWRGSQEGSLEKHLLGLRLRVGVSQTSS